MQVFVHLPQAYVQPECKWVPVGKTPKGALRVAYTNMLVSKKSRVLHANYC